MHCPHCQRETPLDNEQNCAVCGYPLDKNGAVYPLITQRPTQKPRLLKIIGMSITLLTLCAVLYFSAPTDMQQQQLYWRNTLAALSALAASALLIKSCRYLVARSRRLHAERKQFVEDNMRRCREAREVKDAIPLDTRGDCSPGRLVFNEANTLDISAYRNVGLAENSNGRRYFIEYKDYYGNITERIITVKDITQENHTIYIKAYCHLRHDTRTFVLDRIIGRITDVATGEMMDPYSLLHFSDSTQDPQNPGTLLEAIAPYQAELMAMGWDIETTDTAVELYAFFKNGKRRKTPTVSIHYTTREETDEPTQRPWYVHGYTYKYLDKAVSRFMALAREKRPRAS